MAHHYVQLLRHISRLPVRRHRRLRLRHGHHQSVPDRVAVLSIGTRPALTSPLSPRFFSPPEPVPTRAQATSLVICPSSKSYDILLLYLYPPHSPESDLFAIISDRVTTLQFFADDRLGPNFETFKNIIIINRIPVYN